VLPCHAGHRLQCKMGVEVPGFEMVAKRLWRARGPLGSLDYIQVPHTSKSCTSQRRLSEGMSLDAVSDCYHVIYISPFTGKVLLLHATHVGSQKTHQSIY
jgi:hypothetical protein